jgi:hypothetical protein
MAHTPVGHDTKGQAGEPGVTKRAVLISLSEDQAGGLLSLDDVTSDDGITWTQSAHVTRKAFSKSVLEHLDVSEKELADIGLAVLARVNALSKGRKS